MLKRIEIENFKAWRKADLTFGKVTGLFGKNSAGKSSLLHLLLLLKQTRNATDRGTVLDFGRPGAMVNLGTFEDVVHRRDNAQAICWGLEWTLPDALRIKYPPLSSDPRIQGDSLQVRCRVGFRNKRPWPRELVYRFSEEEFRLQAKGKSEWFKWMPKLDLVRTRGRPSRLPHPAKGYLFPGQAKSYFQNAEFLDELELEYEKFMDSIHYLGPLREYPRREYQWAGSIPEDVGQRGERTIDAILAATARKEKRQLGFGKWRRPFQEIIAHWLRELGLIHEFRLEEIAEGTNLYRTRVRTSRSGVWTALTDVGFGVSQVLPVLVLLYYVPEGSTVLMEQPEIHLHPAVQSGLADVMLNVAEVRNVQIVVESHSEHLMRRLQRRVAEQEVPCEDVRLYFVSLQSSPKSDQACIEDLRLNEWGVIENWPEHFFGDEMGEIAAITKASLKRQME